MNKFKKAVFALMTIFPILSLAACNPSKQEAVDKIESYLGKKYDEQFKVTRIGGGYGTITTNTLKADVQPKNKPELKFSAEITKDLKNIWDSYMNSIMADKLNSDAVSLAKSIFLSEVWAKTDMNSPGLAFPDRKLNDKDMSVQEYLEQYPKNGIEIDLYVNSNTEIDTKMEVERINQLADQLIAKGYKKANIYIYINYLNSASFQELNEKYLEFDNSNDGYEYFMQTDKSVAHSTISIKDGKKQETVEEIQNEFLSH